MFPSTLSAINLTRSRLREMGHWIRDELDPVIAREGPEILRPDDVLMLHDFFQALHQSQNITALDLRATGIHKAILDVSGVATRWPGRLADDCDKIISIWTSKFGRLEDLPPFLYGRGGVLDGIASIHESSKQSLTKRWQATCPDKIAPKRSHQRGGLGFRAGAWWINPLFAWHAGIIDGDTVEGGVCYDKEAAYALLLKDTGEIDASDEDNFTYRCGRHDKGKFRLTAATPKCRHPIRVLRSHSINSIWGPKAGVRYEGLYRVVSWTISQIKNTDIHDQDYRTGDIVYDITFKRVDPIPMEEVIKIPTTSQVDEYSEYKRLRKVTRNHHHRGAIIPQNVYHTMTTKLAHQILPHQALQPPQSESSSKGSPSTSRAAASKRSVMSAEPSSSKQSHGLGKDTLEHIVDGEQFSFGSPPKATTTSLKIHLPQTRAISAPHFHDKTPGSTQQSGVPHTFVSNPSSLGSHQSNICKVAPWVDKEPALALLSNEPLPFIERETLGKTWKISREHGDDAGDISPQIAPGQDSRSHTTSPNPIRGRHKKSDNARKHHHPPMTLGHQTDLTTKKEPLKSILVRSLNPMAKLFDGPQDETSTLKAGEFVEGDTSNFTIRRRGSGSMALNPRRAFSVTGRRKRTSSSGAYPLSPIPVRPLSPLSPLLGRKDAGMFLDGCVSMSDLVVFADDGSPSASVAREYTDALYEDPFIDISPTPHTIPVTAKSFAPHIDREPKSTSPTRSIYASPVSVRVKSEPAAPLEMRPETPAGVVERNGRWEGEGGALVSGRLRRFLEGSSEMKSGRESERGDGGVTVTDRISGDGVVRGNGKGEEQ
ncbi:hypothetical protein CC80DRAFT_594834 [Byssothecium circinans]|uniref:YDG domain-containing protein n=1 Tax=Byssothecium circinans TaxID=147558 RepID=A0A6A5TS35_9PLEO|nr:hypothetical protein CC80DRAFT_594834 [Byssothecium circinans]